MPETLHDATTQPVAASYSPHINRSIDNTALEAYMNCPRKFLYSMHLNRRRIGLTKPALAYGTTWHAILEEHYRTGGDRAAVINRAIASWQPHDNPEDHRTLERAISNYDGYLERWGSHEADSKNYGRTVGFPEAPLVEEVVELSWSGAAHPYTGKIDRIFEHQGLYYVEDHKSTSALGKDYFRQWDPSNQMMGYAWLAQKLTGLPIAGVRVNAHGVLKTQAKFERQIMLYSPVRLAEWAENYGVWIRRLDRSLATLSPATLEIGSTSSDLEAFPHQFNACAGKYGQCTYAEVCSSPPSIRARILEMDFADDPWDPTAEEEDA